MRSYSQYIGGDLYRCLLCPVGCELREGDRGKCQVRGVKDDKIDLLSYGQITSLAVEPIEKKPFYHFMPGTKVLSFSTLGCNFSCKFCQNYQISQSSSVPMKRLSLEKAVSTAILKECQGICMTYNEPIPSYEYLIDLAEKAHQAGLYFVVNTNGYVEKEPWADICDTVDAINIDYKATNNNEYCRITGATGSPYYVMLTRLLEVIDRKNIHLEISVPVFYNSTVKDYDGFRRFISYHNAHLPVHLLRVISDHKMIGDPATPESLLLELQEYLHQKLSFVYIENVFSEKAKQYRRTVCPYCQHVIVERDSFDVTTHFDDGCGVCSSFFVLPK